MYNLKATLGIWLGVERSGLITVLNWAAVIATTIGVAWLWRRPPPLTGRLFASRLALTITLGLLVTPYLYAQDSVLLVVPATLGYRVLRGRPAGRWYAAFIVGGPLAFLLGEELVGARLGIRIPVLLMGVLADWLFVMSRGEVWSGPGDQAGNVGARA